MPILPATRAYIKQGKDNKMEKCTGEIIFACGRKYTEVPQKAIDKIAVGTKLSVWKNEDPPKTPQPGREISCLGCPCKRKAKRKQDMFYRKEDLDPKTDEAIKRPSGIIVVCAITELIPDTSGIIKKEPRKEVQACSGNS